MQMKLFVQRLDPRAPLPACQTPGSAAMDLANGVGVIDSDYRGELRVGLTNLSDTPYTVQPGDRVAQLMVVPVARACVLELDELPATQRGAGGFGSTGK